MDAIESKIPVLDNKDRLDALLRIAEFYMAVRKERRQYEWRVSLGLWVGLAGGMISLKGISLLVLVPLLILVNIGHAWVWVRSYYTRNERDSRRAYLYIDKAKELLEPGSVPPPPPYRPHGWLTTGAPLFEVLATMLLSLAWIVYRASN
jgi:hypothetical protein